MSALVSDLIRHSLLMLPMVSDLAYANLYEGHIKLVKA
jgi:hypothetical protein